MSIWTSSDSGANSWLDSGATRTLLTRWVSWAYAQTSAAAIAATTMNVKANKHYNSNNMYAHSSVVSISNGNQQWQRQRQEQVQHPASLTTTLWHLRWLFAFAYDYDYGIFDFGCGCSCLPADYWRLQFVLLIRVGRNISHHHLHATEKYYNTPNKKYMKQKLNKKSTHKILATKTDWHSIPTHIHK